MLLRVEVTIVFNHFLDQSIRGVSCCLLFIILWFHKDVNGLAFNRNRESHLVSAMTLNDDIWHDDILHNDTQQKGFI
jgi:hypothetical protein